MSLFIDFLTFKNILNKKQIHLFDSQYRISHVRYNNLIQSLPQYGGADINNSITLLNIINEKHHNLLNVFIQSLINNNQTRIKYILNNL